VKATSLRPETVLELIARIQNASDLPEALSILIGSLLMPQGVERALVMVAADAELRGALGVGWDPETVRSVAVPLTSSSHPLVRALQSGEFSMVQDDSTLHGLGAKRYGVAPIPAAGSGNPAFGLLVVGYDGAEPQGIKEVVEQVRSLGPALQRTAELDDLRRCTKQLERQRDLHTAIINALPDPVLITDAQNNVLLENQRAESLFTTGEGDSEGRRRAVEINNLLFSSFLTRSTIAGPNSGSRELNLVDPSEGGDLLFEVLSTQLPVALDEGATVSVLRDVTDLKRAATELEHQFKRVRQAELKSRRERDRLNLVLENVGDPILVTDDQTNIILMNREAERLFEVPPGTDLRSQHRREVRANDTKFSSFISDFALSPDHTRIAEFQLTDPTNGQEFPAEVVSGKILNDRAEMTAIVSIVHDLTKVVENERLAGELSLLNEGLEGRIRAATSELEERNSQLEWQSRELERAYRLKSQFLASMSHELRTPINALLGYTSLMRDRIYGALTERQEEALDRMYVASQHLLELVNDILDLAKIEAGKMPIHLERVDVGQLIREVSLTVEPMVRRKKLEYVVDIQAGIPVLDTDGTKVKQIILNLLSNAVKFTHEGSISISARPAAGADGVEIEIADTGIGISEEDLPKIFEDFRQVDQSSTREYGGTGLGLSITKKLLSLLGGTIHVDSCRGEGSTFIVRLPLRSEEISAEEQVTQAGRAADQVVRTTSGENC
jgi:PAS domain S-box-containing protein